MIQSERTKEGLITTVGGRLEGTVAEECFHGSW